MDRSPGIRMQEAKKRRVKMQYSTFKVWFYSLLGDLITFNKLSVVYTVSVDPMKKRG